MARPDPHPVIPDAQSVSGKAVLVTGGTTGIGRATARLLLGQGARVVVFGRDEGALEDALSELEGAGGEVYGLTADVSRMDDVRRVFAEVDRRLGRLDILIANAAVTGEGFEEDDLGRIEYVVRTNVVGYLACAHEAVARMKPQGRGHVVLVGSMSADLREPDGTTYVATKGAIQAMAESLRKTANEDGIKVTLVEPGKVATDMVDRSEAEKARAVAEGEMLTPEDIAGSVLYALLQPARCDVVSVQLRPHRQVI
jgi:NADP-dependent 3-hydroxy acid dehydrogenase YdfG